MGDVPDRNAAYKAFMDAEIAALLADLDVGDEVEDQLPGPDNTAAAQQTPDLDQDPLNDPHLPTRAERRVTITPDAAARTDQQPITPQCVVNVPIAPARMAEPAQTKTSVAPKKSMADTSFANYTAIIRSANSTARAAGNMVASVVTALGEDGASVAEVDIHSWFFRIAQATFCAELGATASVNPTERTAVAQTSLANLGTSITAFPDMLPVYLPRQLGLAGKAAVASLLVVGGAGAYTWRYRGGQENYDLIMPAASRWKTPGGYNQILLVVDDDVQVPPVGGQALTIAALRGVEAFYRQRYGNDLMDSAWRSVLALAHVYVAPLPIADPAHLSSGNNFQFYQVQQATRAPDPVIDLGGVDGSVGGAPPDDPDQNFGAYRPFKALDVTRDERQFKDDIWRCFQEGFEEGDYDNDEWKLAGSELGAGYDDLVPDAQGASFAVRMHIGEGRERRTVRAEMHIPWDEIYRQIQVLSDSRRAAARLHRNILENGGTLMFPVEEGDDEGDDVPEDTTIRNVYGANDYSGVHMPLLDLTTAVGVISGYLLPTRLVRAISTFSPNNRRARGKMYAAHLHLANFYAMVGAGLSPVDLRMKPEGHAHYLLKIKPALRPVFIIASLDPVAYSTQNWHVLESSFLFSGVNNLTPYAGYAPAGTWVSDVSARVDLAVNTTNFAAIEAAVRGEMQYGASFDAQADFAGTHFGVILGPNNLIHPFPITPRILALRAYDTVRISAGQGTTIIPQGSNTNGHFVKVR